jgi:hypothetical protein
MPEKKDRLEEILDKVYSVDEAIKQGKVVRIK